MVGRLGFVWSCAVFVLTALVFVDLGIGLIFGEGLYDLVGGVQSPLAVALADHIASGNPIAFYAVCSFLVLFLAWLMFLSAGSVFGRRSSR